jgi:hypothetical protein
MKRTLVILGMLCAAAIAARAREPRLAGADSRADAVQNAAQPAARPKEIHVDPKILAGYVGRYQVTPSVILTVRLNGDHLFAFATGQQLAEMYASSEKDFFLDAADTKFTFATDSQGKATELILHMGGQDQHAPRVTDAK